MTNHKGWFFTNMNKQWEKVPLPPSECVQAAHITNVALRLVQPVLLRYLWTFRCRRMHSFGRAAVFFIWQSSTPVHRDGWLQRKKQTERPLDKKEASELRCWCYLSWLLISLDSFSQSQEADSEHLMLQSRCVKQVSLNTFLTILPQCSFCGRQRL